MEVSLVDSAGLPDGCLLSIRAGTTRRQAPADAEKWRLPFPRKINDELVKVDLLAPVGSSSFSAVEGVESYAVSVPLSGTSSQAQLTLQVRELQEAARPRRRHKAVCQGHSYLDSHNLLVWLQELVDGFMDDKPDDPWAYIEAKVALARQESKEDVDMPALRSQAMRCLVDASSDGSLATALTAMQPANQRHSSNEGLPEKTQDGERPAVLFGDYYAQNILKACGTECWQAMHSRYRREQAQNGESQPLSFSEYYAQNVLKACGTECWQAMHARYSEKKVAPPQSSASSGAAGESRETASAQESSDLSAARSQAMSCLLEASSDGSLARALSAMMMQPPPVVDASPPRPSKEGSLPEKAPDSGSLATAPSAVEPAGQQTQVIEQGQGSLAKEPKEDVDMPALRSQAMRCLVDASSDGSLATALTAMQPANQRHSSNEVLPEKTQDGERPAVPFGDYYAQNILKACGTECWQAMHSRYQREQDSKIEDVPSTEMDAQQAAKADSKPHHEMGMDDIRTLLRRALKNATETRRLHQALQQHPPPPANVPDRQRAKDAPTELARGGADVASSDVESRKTPQEEASAEAEATPHQDGSMYPIPSLTGDVRQRTLKVLMHAIDDGSLDFALGVLQNARQTGEAAEELLQESSSSNHLTEVDAAGSAGEAAEPPPPSTDQQSVEAPAVSAEPKIVEEVVAPEAEAPVSSTGTASRGDVRGRTLDLLFGALDDGSLDHALAMLQAGNREGGRKEETAGAAAAPAGAKLDAPAAESDDAHQLSLGVAPVESSTQGGASARGDSACSGPLPVPTSPRHRSITSEDDDRSTVLDSTTTDDAIRETMDALLVGAVQHIEAVAKAGPAAANSKAAPENVALESAAPNSSPSRTVTELREILSKRMSEAAEDGSLRTALTSLSLRTAPETNAVPEAALQAQRPDGLGQTAMQQDLGVAARPRPFPAADVLGLKDLEATIRKRNERFRRENEALRRDNQKLKEIWEYGEVTAKSVEANANLRKELANLSKKVGLR